MPFQKTLFVLSVLAVILMAEAGRDRQPAIVLTNFCAQIQVQLKFVEIIEYQSNLSSTYMISSLLRNKQKMLY